MNISNLMGLNSCRNLGKTAKGKVVASNRLATGKRINSAKDDASGLAISEKMKGQIRGLNQADRNIADGMSVINTMDGGMDGITEILQRQRELTIQAMNDTNTPEDKELIQGEIDQLSKEITSMANKTQFNGIPLLNVPPGTTVIGTVQELTIGPGETINFGYIEVKEGESFTVKVDEFSPILGGDWPDMNITAPNGDTFGFGSMFLNGGTYCTDTTSDAYSSANYNGWGHDNETYTFNNISSEGAGKWEISIVNGTDGSSDFKLSSTLPITPYGVDKTITNELHIQAGANGGQGIYINRYDCRAETLGVDSLPIDPYENASKSLDNIDKAINEVSANRANAGAQFNRLEYTQSSVQISSENLESSKSRILDTDMAKETMAIVKNGLLENAAIAMLSQSNQQTVENVQALLQ